MTAEEVLAQLYESQKFGSTTAIGRNIHITGNGGIYIAAEHINLIANLVVERLKASNKMGKE